MPLTFDQMLEYIARGHAFPKHKEGMGQAGELMENVDNFRHTDTSASPTGRVLDLGRDLHINTPEDLMDYMRRMIDSPDTRGYTTRDGAIHLFNSRDNTYLLIDPNSSDMGTIHRYPNSAANFSKKEGIAGNGGDIKQKFNNELAPGSVRAQVDRLVENNPSPRRLRVDVDDPDVLVRPGAEANANPDYAGSNNMSRNGMSADYTAYARHMDNLAATRAGLDAGKGYVAGLDDAGRPSQMFFMDEAAHTVTEINGREITVHRFDNLPETERAAATEQFFEMNKPSGANVVEGGYNNLVKQFQAENPGKLPLAGSNTRNVISSIEGGSVTAVDNVPYNSVDDAARAYIGFTGEQAGLFNAIPENISAEVLEGIDDPKVASALQDLSTAKEYSLIGNGDDAVDGLRNFNEVFEGMDATTRSGVMDALTAMGRSPAVDAARGADAAVDALDAISDLARVARIAKTGRLGLNMSKAGIITTAVTTVAAVALTEHANAAVLDIADQLHAAGHLTDEALADYKAMMDDVGPMLTGQAADPFITAIPGMAIVERIAYNRFQEFSDKHQLPQNIHEMLSPSIVAGTSLRGEIGQDTFKFIPDDPAQVPEELKALVEAKNAVTQSRENYWETYGENQPPLLQRVLMDSGGGHGGFMLKTPSQALTEAHPEVIQAQEQLDQARANFQTEFDKVLADPDAARALADLMTEDQLIDIIKQTAKFNTQDQHPLIQEYVRAQAADAAFYDLGGAWDNMKARDAAEQALRDNPEVMREYLSNIFVPPQQEPQGPQIENTSTGFNFEEDPNFIMVASAFERLQAGETLDSTEIQEIQTFMANADSESAIQIVDELKERYPNQASEFIDEKPDGDVQITIPVDAPQYESDNAGMRL